MSNKHGHLLCLREMVLMAISGSLGVTSYAKQDMCGAKAEMLGSLYVFYNFY